MEISNTVCTGNDTYLVEFLNSTNKRYITEYNNLKEPLRKLKDGLFLKDIYRFNNSKLKFERVPKSSYKTLFGWCTESMEILKDAKIIK